MARKISKYYVGMLLRHKKHGFTVKLLDKHRTTNWVFEVVAGELQEKLRPGFVFDEYLITYRVYSYATIRNSFEP